MALSLLEWRPGQLSTPSLNLPRQGESGRLLRASIPGMNIKALL